MDDDAPDTSFIPSSTSYILIGVEPVIVRRGEGHHVGNIEFLARSAHTSRFNLGILKVPAHSDGPAPHVHESEDDSFYVLEGELTFTVAGTEVVAEAGTFVLVPPGVEHTFANRSGVEARALNIHAPAGFDLRLEAD